MRLEPDSGASGAGNPPLTSIWLCGPRFPLSDVGAPISRVLLASADCDGHDILLWPPRSAGKIVSILGLQVPIKYHMRLRRLRRITMQIVVFSGDSVANPADRFIQRRVRRERRFDSRESFEQDRRHRTLRDLAHHETAPDFRDMRQVR